MHAAGGVHVKLPYDCQAGLKNWHIGWSAPKKACRLWNRLLCIRLLHQYSEFATILTKLPFVFCVGLHRPGAAATISWAAKVEQAGANVNAMSRKDIPSVKTGLDTDLTLLTPKV